LSPRHAALTAEREKAGIAISAITFWEVAMLVGKRRLDLKGETLQRWFDRVQMIPTVIVLEASPRILVASTTLPGDFHPDPADRIIVATAIEHGLSLLTEDRKILDYEHVRTIAP
jgi:PIN domain nuclease of toxin-antitoxin system